MKYEGRKHSGELPIIGVNTFLAKASAETAAPQEIELTRASNEEKSSCVTRLAQFQATHRELGLAALSKLKAVALRGDNLFAGLLEATEHCSLGQITDALYEVGGEYRRNV